MINGINLPGTYAAPRTLRPSGVTVPGPTSAVKATPGEQGVATAAGDLAAAGPPVDVERVAAVRAAIADGSYQINPEAIANKMVALDMPLKG